MECNYLIGENKNIVFQAHSPDSFELFSGEYEAGGVVTALSCQLLSPITSVASKSWTYGEFRTWKKVL